MFWQADTLDVALVISFDCLFEIIFSLYCVWLASQCLVTAEVGFDIQ